MDAFNLSKERVTKYGNGDKGYYLEEDVKEFIKRIKDVLMSAEDLPTTKKEEVKALDYAIEVIDKYAGKELI